MSCQHPECTAPTVGRQRYCAEHRQNRWAIWRYYHGKKAATEEGLLPGQKRCHVCARVWRPPQMRARLCPACKAGLADVRRAERRKQYERTKHLRASRAKPKVAKPLPPLLTPEQRHHDQLLRQFLRSTGNMRASA